MNGNSILTDAIESIENTNLKIKAYAIAFASDYVTESERKDLMNLIISKCNCIQFNCNDMLGNLNKGNQNG